MADDDTPGGKLGARVLIMLYGLGLVLIGLQPVKNDTRRLVHTVKAWFSENFERTPRSIREGERAAAAPLPAPTKSKKQLDSLTNDDRKELNALVDRL